MQILRFKHTGVDTVTFWCSPEQPEGCFIHFGGQQPVLALVALSGKDQPTKVGLLPMPIPLYNLVAQTHDDKHLGQHDYDFVSDHREIFVVARQGGMDRQTPEVRAEMAKVRAELDQPDAGAQIRAAASSG